MMSTAEMQEWVKIGVSGLTPLSVAILTYFISKSLNERATSLKINETIVGEKQRIYGEIGKCLNIIYVYVLDIGDFRQYSPAEIIATKRDADRIVYMYQPYWSSETMLAYNTYMHSAFQMFSGAGRDAKIRSYTVKKRLATLSNALWKSDYVQLFSEERDREFPKKYDKLVKYFMLDIVSSKIVKHHDH